MNGRWVLAAAFALSVGVVACGGGGGGGGNPNPPTPATPTPVSTPTQTPTQSPVPPPTPPVAQATCNPAPAVPATTGNYEFTGTLKQQATYFYPATVSPTTSPTAPPTCVVESVAAVFSSGTTTDPSGKGGTDLHENELDASPLSTTSVSSDAWAIAVGAQNALTATQVVSPNNGTPTSTTLQEFTNPPVIGQSSTGTFGASNSDAGTLNQTTSYGLSYSRAINADGSYSETGTAQAGNGTAGGSITISEASDGSGSITGPNPSGFAPKSFSAPVAGKITLTIHTSPSSTKLIPVWWSALSFYSENNSIVAVSSEPSPCIGTAAYKVERIVTQLDTIMGYTETTTYDTYDTQSGNGADCVAYSDTINNYYDWSGDILLANRFSSNGAANPLSTVVTTEALALVPGQTGNRPFDVSRGGPVSAASVSAAAAAHFNAIVAQTRARVLAHALRLRTTNLAGGI